MEIHTGAHQLTVNHKLSFPLCVDNGDYAPVSSRYSHKRDIHGKMPSLCVLRAPLLCCFSCVALAGIAFYHYQSFNQRYSWSSLMSATSIQQEV